MKTLMLILLCCVSVSFGQLDQTGRRPLGCPGLSRVTSVGVSGASGSYGSGINADALNNLRIGLWDAQGSYAFIAEYTGEIDSFRTYIIWTDGGGGYDAGTGGSLLFTLQSDDETADHFPAGDTLASFLYSTPKGGGNFPLLGFTSPASVVAGQKYHLVTFNPDAAPTENYVSLDYLYMYDDAVPEQMRFADSAWRGLVKYGTDPWQIMDWDGDSHTPILELQYTDGHNQGMGYMEVWSEAPQPISGDSSVRQNFTVSDSSRLADSVMVRVKRNSGTDSLTIRVETSNGDLVASGEVYADTVYGWVTLIFTSTVTLQSGSSYNLVLQSPSSSIYETFPIREGSSSNVAYSSETYFSDGYAQFTIDGSTWAGWTMVTEDRRDADLQFMFTR